MTGVWRLIRLSVLCLALILGGCDRQRLAYNRALALYHQQNNDTAAAAQFATLAQQGYPPAQFRLGLMEFYGLGVAQQPSVAISRFQKLAAQNHLPASYFLAGCYLEGVGIKKDETAAFQLYLQLARLGFVPAQYRVGLMQIQGKGIDPNAQQAIPWLKKAAKGGHHQAQKKLISIYTKGLLGIPKDNSQAQYWRHRLVGRR